MSGRQPRRNRLGVPDSGAVLFDGHDLLNLDIEAVRRHLGVVLQDGQAVADTILNNVGGSARLSADEIWRCRWGCTRRCTKAGADSPGTSSSGC